MSLFRSILFWLVLVVLGALLAQVLLQDPGYVLVRYRGTDYTTTVAAGVGMLSIPLIHSPALLLLPMLGVGLAWASIMGNPYIMLAGCIPPARTGVYMGIFNMFIVIPMIIQIFTLPLYYRSWLGGNPENVIRLAGALLLCAAVAVLFVKLRPQEATKT